MANLLRETIKVLKECNRALDEVEWVGYEECELKNWRTCFMRTNYDDGYGGVEIPMNLVVCGKDWWLERHEYDGAEWWEYKRQPQRPQRSSDDTEPIT